MSRGVLHTPGKQEILLNRNPSALVESLGEVGDDVVDMLRADAEADG